MPRPLRFAPAGWPLHVWCRGNRQQDIFCDDADRRRYLALMIRHCQENGSEILAYCLMRNHVHLILQPSKDDGLTRTMHRINSEYAQAMHQKMQVAGHFWQGRFGASVMDDRYLWTALRYVELNPVRVGIAVNAEQWPWSSAAAHVGSGPWPNWLAREPFCSRRSTDDWRLALANPVLEPQRGELRQAIRRNRPLAARELLLQWESEYGIQLRPRDNGRPKRPTIAEERQLAAFANGS